MCRSLELINPFSFRDNETSSDKRRAKTKAENFKYTGEGFIAYARSRFHHSGEILLSRYLVRAGGDAFKEFNTPAIIQPFQSFPPTRLRERERKKDLNIEKRRGEREEVE